MRRLGSLLRGLRLPAGALRDESGATLVEFAIVLSIFLLILFGLIDFGRLGYTWVMADKAMQRAARIAAVRPPVCSGVPEINFRNAAASPEPQLGTSCGFDDGSGNPLCASSTVTCTGAEATTVAGIATANEIEAAIQGLMPAGTTIANIRFTYSSDPDLGFLGGPYVPVATAELDDATFRFVSPLGGLARLAGALGAADIGVPCDGGMFCISIPAMSVSLPGEDLAQGSSG